VEKGIRGVNDKMPDRATDGLPGSMGGGESGKNDSTECQRRWGIHEVKIKKDQ